MAHMRSFCFVKYPQRRSSCINATLTCLASSWKAEITNSPTAAYDDQYQIQQTKTHGQHSITFEVLHDRSNQEIKK